MKKWIFVALAAISLSGCITDGTTDVLVHQTMVVMPPERMYICPVAAIPSPDKLTDLEVAHLLNKLDGNNHICRRSLLAIHNYLKRAKAIIK